MFFRASILYLSMQSGIITLRALNCRKLTRVRIGLPKEHPLESLNLSGKALQWKLYYALADNASFCIKQDCGNLSPTKCIEFCGWTMSQNWCSLVVCFLFLFFFKAAKCRSQKSLCMQILNIFGALVSGQYEERKCEKIWNCHLILLMYMQYYFHPRPLSSISKLQAWRHIIQFLNRLNDPLAVYLLYSTNTEHSQV